MIDNVDGDGDDDDGVEHWRAFLLMMLLHAPPPPYRPG